ncbi:MAG: ZIP family metal transporter [Alphaproteobacteria bacterium]|nr:ZIP family metal transporter [Alphaproteobacteria bacterium]
MSAAGVAVALLAAATARRLADWIALAAGVVLLAVAGLHLAPEAVSAGGAAGLFVVGGAAVGAALEAAFQNRSDAAAPGKVRLAAWLALLVLAGHSTLDGAVYSVSFHHGYGTGLLTSLGLILHEAPEGAVAMMLALQAGLRTPSALALALASSSVTTPLGWGLGQLAGASGQGATEAMFAASAGLMLFVGWHLMVGGWRAVRQRRL